MTLVNSDFLNDILRITFTEQESKQESSEINESLNSPPLLGRAQLEAGSDLILSGSELFTAAIKYYNSDNEIRWHYKDGDSILKGQKVATIVGHVHDILKSETISLNFLTLLSSVATYTYHLKNSASEFSCKILKSTNFLIGLHSFENKAFLDGGGYAEKAYTKRPTIHQSHIARLGGMHLALDQLSDDIKNNYVFNILELSEAQLAIKFGVKYLQLENLPLEDISRLLKNKDPSISFEILGNIETGIVLELAKMGIEWFRPQKNHNFEAKYTIRWEWKPPS